MKKTYQIRIFPTKDQILDLINLSNIRTDVWNTLLDIQESSYKTSKKIHSRFDLINLLPNLKISNQSWTKLNSKATQTIATELFQSYQSFFKLIKKDKNARPPKKKEISNNFHTLCFNQSGWSIKQDSIIINKLPLKFKSNLTNLKTLNIKEIRIKFRNNKWLVDLVCDEEIQYQDKLEIETKVLAIDLGLSKLATGVDNNANTIILHNKSKKINKYFNRQINKVKSKLSKKVKRSKTYQKLNQVKQKLYSKKNSQIKQTLHIQSKKLANMNYNTIVVGDLTVKKLMNKEKQKYSGIRKSFNDSNISMFTNFLTYKCQKKNMNLIKIDERHTTQLNSLTGKLFKEKVELNNRTVELQNGIFIDRDINSAINILKRFYDNHLASMNRPLSENFSLNVYQKLLKNVSVETQRSLVVV